MKNGVLDFLSVIVEPIYDYYLGLVLVFRPRILAEAVRSEHMDAKMLAKISLSSILFITLLEVILPGFKHSLQIVNAPILNEIFVLMRIYIFLLTVMALNYIPIKLFGGQATFGSNLLMASIIVMVCQPLAIVVEYLYFVFVWSRFRVLPINIGVSGMVMAFLYMKAASHLNRVGVSRILVACVMGFLLAIGLFYFASKIYSSYRYGI